MITWEKQNKIKALYNLYSKPVREKYGLTQMEYSILLFLYRNPDYDTASSIVQIRQLTKSHVSSAVKRLENRKLITKEYHGKNNKTIHLKLTEAAEMILQESTRATEKYNDCLFEGFTEKELQQISRFFERMCKNAEDELQKMEEGMDRA